MDYPLVSADGSCYGVPVLILHIVDRDLRPPSSSVSRHRRNRDRFPLSGGERRGPSRSDGKARGVPLLRPLRGAQPAWDGHRRSCGVTPSPLPLPAEERGTCGGSGDSLLGRATCKAPAFVGRHGAGTTSRQAVAILSVVLPTSRKAPCKSPAFAGHPPRCSGARPQRLTPPPRMSPPRIAGRAPAPSRRRTG
jgi:hypothetical protein